MEDPHDDLEHAADERQSDGVRGVVVDDRVTELGGEQRHDGRRAEVDVLGRAEQTVDETRHVRRVQSVLPAPNDTTPINAVSSSRFNQPYFNSRFLCVFKCV